MSLVEDTLKALGLAKAQDPQLKKSWTQSSSATSGLTEYDLEGPAKTLYPVITPLRNLIPRVGGGKGIQANWRAITGVNINGTSAGVSEGNRGGVIATSTADYFAAFRTLGLEDNVTFEAESAGEGFDDIRARAVEGLLRSLFIQQEKIMLGANASLALGVTPTPTIAAVGSGGSIPTSTAVYVYCVALSLEGFLNAGVASGIPVGAITRANADGSSDTYGGGTAQKSAAANVSTGANSSSVTASVAAVNGAAGYAWFWGASAAAATLGAITTINSAVLTTAAGTGTQTSASSGVDWTADHSTNTLVYDGLLTQVYKTGSNSYVAVQPTGTAGVGTPLTSDGEGGVVEIDTALKAFWDNYRLSPDSMYVSSQEQNTITKKVMTNAGGNGAQRFTVDVKDGLIAGGFKVTSYLNKYTMEGATEIPIKLHPNLPAGTIMFYTNRLPYPLSNVRNVVQIQMRKGYYQLEWPLRSRKYEYGVYTDEVLQNYFPPAFGAITNIANG
ncbi:MAG: hypothetical protein ACRD34_00215 [Bryobacteraceae bacterium]